MGRATLAAMHAMALTGFSLFLLMTSSIIALKAQSQVFTFPQIFLPSTQAGDERLPMKSMPEIKEDKKRAFTSFMLRNRNSRDCDKAIDQMKALGLLPLVQGKRSAWATKKY